METTTEMIDYTHRNNNLKFHWLCIRNIRDQKVVENKFKMLKLKNDYPRILYLAKIYFKNEGTMSVLSGQKKKKRKTKSKKFITSRSTLKK